MLDSECRERTETAESERRGVLTGGCGRQVSAVGDRPGRRTGGTLTQPAGATASAQ